MSEATPEAGPEEGTRREGWSPAALRAAVVMLASVVGLVIIPNELLTYLSLHVVPKERDVLVTLWWAVAFIACTWLFLRIQPRRKG